MSHRSPTHRVQGVHGSDFQPAKLRRLQQRLRGQRRAVDALWLTSAAFVAMAVGVATARLWGLESLTAPTLLAALLGAGGAALWRSATHRTRRWDLLRTARFAEHRVGLAEQLSTAVEFAADQRPVIRALRESANAKIEKLEPQGLTPWRVPLAPVAGFLLSTILFSVVWWAPWSVLSAGVATIAGSQQSGAAAASADAVRALADQLEGEARRSRDAYLASLASELRELADQSGDSSIDEATLNRLLEQIAEAAGGSVSSEDLRARIARTDAALDQARNSPEEIGSRPTPPSRMQVGGPQQEMDFGALFTQVQESDPLTAGAGGGDGAVGRDTNFGVVDPDSVDDPSAAQVMDFDGVPGGAGESIGAADSSGAGASRVGGRGTESLEGEASDADFAASATEALTIAGLEREEGRRIEVELPPSAQWEGYDPSLFQVGRWLAAPVAPQPDLSPSLAYQRAAARYFIPSQATASRP